MYALFAMLTKPTRCVRMTLRAFEGKTGGPSKSRTVYGTSLEELWNLIDRAIARESSDPSCPGGRSTGELRKRSLGKDVSGKSQAR
jgi:hypothetical protein